MGRWIGRIAPEIPGAISGYADGDRAGHAQLRSSSATDRWQWTGLIAARRLDGPSARSEYGVGLVLRSGTSQTRS